MEEERLTRPWKLGCVVCAALFSPAAGWILHSWIAVGHDKSINSQLAMLWLDPRDVPLGLVQPANNSWMKQAFVAEKSSEDGKAIAVLILDDITGAAIPHIAPKAGHRRPDQQANSVLRPVTVTNEKSIT